MLVQNHGTTLSKVCFTIHILCGVYTVLGTSNEVCVLYDKLVKETIWWMVRVTTLDITVGWEVVSQTYDILTGTYITIPNLYSDRRRKDNVLKEQSSALANRNRGTWICMCAHKTAQSVTRVHGVLAVASMAIQILKTIFMVSEQRVEIPNIVLDYKTTRKIYELSRELLRWKSAFMKQQPSLY